MQQHGRPTDQIAQKNAQITSLEAERGILHEANRAVRGEANELKLAIRKLENEKESLSKKSERMTKEIDEQQVTMKKLEEQISKQKVTIKVQSDQIAQRASANKAATTPHHHTGANSSAFSNIYDHPPPSYNPYSRTTTPAPPNSAPTMARQRSAGAAPPPQSTPFSGPSRGGRVTPTAPPHPFGGTQLMRIQEKEPTLDFSSEFTRIFKLTEAWARAYVNLPDQEIDDLMPSSSKVKISQTTNPEIATRLMASSSTRFLAMAKTMNVQIATRALRPLMIKGYTPFYDIKISEMRVQLQGIIPQSVRRGLMVACMDTFKDMVKENGFRPYLDQHVASQTREMWDFLEPLFAPGVARNEAWEDLTNIWRQATRVGVNMLLKASHWSVDFPPTGQNSHFNPAQMVSRDLNFKQDPQTLASMGVSIRLAITPVVTETDYSVTALVPRVLHYSNVLLQL